MKEKFILILTGSRRELIAQTNHNSLEDFHRQAEQQLGERIINISDDFVGDPESVEVDMYVWDPYYGPGDYLDEGYAPEPVLPIPCRCCGGSGYM